MEGTKKCGVHGTWHFLRERVYMSGKALSYAQEMLEQARGMRHGVEEMEHVLETVTKVHQEALQLLAGGTEILEAGVVLDDPNSPYCPRGGHVWSVYLVENLRDTEFVLDRCDVCGRLRRRAQFVVGYGPDHYSVRRKIDDGSFSDACEEMCKSPVRDHELEEYLFTAYAEVYGEEEDLPEEWIHPRIRSYPLGGMRVEGPGHSPENKTEQPECDASYGRSPLSQEERERRKPLPPDALVDALNDRVHMDIGRGRPARTVRSQHRQESTKE